MTTVSAAIFLVSPGTNIATTSNLGLSEHGYWGQAAANGNNSYRNNNLATLLFENNRWEGKRNYLIFERRTEIT